MASEILITGGTGKTGRRLADRLRAMGRAPRVAGRISEVAGLPVKQERLAEAQLASRLNRMGIEAPYARALAAMDTAIADGAEDRLTDQVSPEDHRQAADRFRCIRGGQPPGLASTMIVC